MNDFDRIIPRRGTNSYKWDSAPNDDVIPMWVADMDFQTAPAIIEALRRRVEHGIFGYTRVPQAYYDAVTSWFSQRHGWNFTGDSIIYTSGVVPAISAIIKALATPGDKVIVQTPVYNCFFSSIRNNDCEILENPLICKSTSGGRLHYEIDFDDLERKAADPSASLLLLCNPHNPAGRVWTKEELSRINEICLRHGVIVISDEIHCELVFPGHKYTPFASISDSCRHNCVVCCSPTKAFNIAGLQIANIVCDNPEWRRLIDKAININEVCDVNPFGVEALIAAYTRGAEWLADLIGYLHDNYKTLCGYFEKYLPHLYVTELEGTYLVWVDCHAYGNATIQMEEELLEQENLWLNAGDMYGKDGFLRINIACPRSVMLEGLDRLKNYFGKKTTITQESKL